MRSFLSTKSQKSHHDAMKKVMTFIAVMENQALSIDQQLNSERSKRAAENHTKLRSIAATIIFCGRLGIALRGHCDDGPVVQTETEINRGNFQALLHFRTDADDTVLKEHLRTASRNATYTSKEIQNEMIGVCGDIIQNKILQRIRNANSSQSLRMRQPMQQIMSNCPSVFVLWRMVCPLRSFSASMNVNLVSLVRLLPVTFLPTLVHGSWKHNDTSLRWGRCNGRQVKGC